MMGYPSFGRRGGDYSYSEETYVRPTPSEPMTAEQAQEAERFRKEFVDAMREVMRTKDWR